MTGVRVARRAGTPAAPSEREYQMNDFNRTSRGRVSMPYPNASRSASVAVPATALYKPDHPRWIDYHIDFFGDGAPARLTAIAVCGEAVLRLPA